MNLEENLTAIHEKNYLRNKFLDVHKRMNNRSSVKVTDVPRVSQ